jgi:hypothetical protein
MAIRRRALCVGARNNVHGRSLAAGYAIRVASAGTRQLKGCRGP